MYDGAVTSVIIKGGITYEFPMTLDLHQESSLSQYFFALVMEKLTESIQEEVAWCICPL